MPSTPKTFGTAHLYGVAGSVTNATVLSAKKKSKHLMEESTQDEQGREIERRYDDVCDEMTLELKIRSTYTIPAVGTTMSYASVTWEITEVGEDQVNKGFRTVSLNIKKSENISYS